MASPQALLGNALNSSAAVLRRAHGAGGALRRPALFAGSCGIACLSVGVSSSRAADQKGFGALFAAKNSKNVTTKAGLKEGVTAPKAGAPAGPYSSAVKAGGFLYVSGVLGTNPETGSFDSETVDAQMVQLLKNMEEVLKAGGAELSDVVKTTIMLSDMGDFSAVNAIYAKSFSEPYPARSTYQVAKLPKNAKVEIECIALLK
eukprot:TRINITY_DN30093_c0_g1_i1.p1 TRINITY_DN30093_c0_g1~~TRINITY_DN30093_c0_g1_i1.p1  ORF type:complete len:203 (-),score=40.72 TRINITY_DN30093_c0_g1_i1:547-1155(-)